MEIGKTAATKYISKLVLNPKNAAKIISLKKPRPRPNNPNIDISIEAPAIVEANLFFIINYRVIRPKLISEVFDC